DSRYDPLFERMRSMLVTWERESDRVKLPGDSGATVRPALVEVPSPGTAKDVCLFVVPEDFDEDDLIEAARRNIRQKRHWQITDTLVVPETSEGRESFLREVKKRFPEGGSHRVIILDELKNPAVQERTDFLKALRRSIGNKPTIVMALLGEPSDDPLGGDPPKVELSVWEKTLQALGDPRLRVITFKE
ncbi:MAG: DUF2868 domain-containing protein, partial [Verrucomicrobiae bacterium]|nr:DUF2868 domain-containing protein [Verrucomicrobiae bacterium]